MGGLADYVSDPSQEDYQYTGSIPVDPSQAGIVTPGMMNPEVNSALGKLVTQVADNMGQDYMKSRKDSQDRSGALQQAANDYANSAMSGYDGNAYDANAWAQAGIGAAHPTLSALESLNRAVAGYSGVKLQQRADYGKRVQEEKQQKLAYLQALQAADDKTQTDSAKELTGMYKASLANNAAILRAGNGRFVNVPGVGLVDKNVIVQGGDYKKAVVVPSFKAAELIQSIQIDVAKQAEQDKNLHFANPAEQQAWIARETQRRISMLDLATGGMLTQHTPGAAAGDVTQLIQGVPPANAHVPTSVKVPDNLNTPLPASEMVRDNPADTQRMLQSFNQGVADNPKSDLGKATTSMGTTPPPPMSWSGPPGATPPFVDPASLPQVQDEQEPSTWGSYIKSMPAPVTTQPTGMYNKAAAERQIEQGKVAEKNAEDAYQKVADQAVASTAWMDTTRSMASQDLSATGSFANVKNYAGKLLESMGVGNSELAKQATTLSSLNALIMQGIQQRLSVQNGVQARDDAIREQQSFAQISDPKQVFKALIAQAQAKAGRAADQSQFWAAWKHKNGSYIGAGDAWNKYIKDTPIFTMYGGKPTYMQPWVDGFIKRNATQFAKDKVLPAQQYNEAVQAWRRVAKGGK